MKKNDLILLIAIGLYSGLFYEQVPGINFLLFTVSILILSIALRKEVVGYTSWRIAALGALISAICIAWHGNLLSFIANAISLSLVSKLAVNKRSSVIAALLISLVSTIISTYQLFVNKFFPDKEREPVISADTKNKFSTRVFIFGIPAVVLIVFIYLYRASNPVFDYFAAKINLDFISFQWVMFTISGWLIMYAFFFYKDIKAVTNYDIIASGTIIQGKLNPGNRLNKMLNVENENTSGIVLFAVLNLLLLVVNVIDINYNLLGPAFGIKLPHGISHSQIVHQGVDALIWSIILAVAIILYHFRGRLNFFENNKALKILACLWIAQNIFMVFSTGVRNYMYISADGITAKRIGVYFYLGLCVIGLLYTFLKIIKRNTNWQLVRQVSWAVYGILVLSCFVNWEAYITDYNVRWQERFHKKIDGGYLISLNADNLEKLADLRNVAMAKDTLNTQWKLIDEEIYHFLCRTNHTDWRSWNLDDSHVVGKLEKLSAAKKLDSLYLSGYGTYDIKDINELAPLKLKKLSIENAYLPSVQNITSLGTLQELQFKKTTLSSFYGFEKLKNLTVLRLEGVSVDDFSSIARLKNVKKIYLRYPYNTQPETLRQILPNTEIIVN